MPTLAQFTELIKPYTKQVKVNMHLDMDKITFLKSRLRFISEKLDTTRCSKLGSLGSQIIKLSRKRSEDIVVPYLSFKDSDKHGFGRVKPVKTNDVAYVQITRPIRQFLVRDFCTDIDIKNCHPEFMNQLHKMYTGSTIPELDDWNKNREQYFKLVISKSAREGGITRDDAKKLAFVFMYEGNVSYTFAQLGLDEKDSDLAPIFNVVQGLSQAACKLANQIKKDFPKMWDSIPTDKAGSARERASKFSTLMQHIERRVVGSLMNLALDKGLQVHDICHDGLLISDNLVPLSEEQSSELCREAEALIKEEWGFDLSILAKEMDNPLADELDQWYFSYRDVDNEIENDMEAVSKFRAKYGGRLVFCNGDWYIRPIEEFFWKRGDAAVRKAIGDCQFFKVSGKSKVPYGLNHGGISNIFKVLNDNVDELSDDKFIMDLNDQLRGLVYWEDKHLDVETGLMHINDKHSALAPVIYIHRPAPDFQGFSDDCPSMQRLNLLLQGMYPEQRVDYYHLIGRMGAGYVTDKQWVALEGLRNTSKSTINGIVSKSFDEYVAFVNPPFTQRYDTDSAAKNRWVKSCGCHLRRIAIGAEKDTTVDRDGSPTKSVLDGNVIKKIIANGYNDYVVVRGHCENETPVKVNTGFLFSFNCMPTSNPPDAIETMVPFNLEIKFTDNQSEVEHYPQFFMKRDQSIAEYVNDSEVQDCFLWCCLVRHYRHCRLDTTKCSMAKDIVEIRSSLGEVTPLSVYSDYCVAGDKLDCQEALDEFRRILDDPTYSLNKLSRFMKKMGHAKGKGKGSPYYRGVQLKVREVQATEDDGFNSAVTGYL